MTSSPAFARSWSALMAACIRAGMHIRVIHNVDRGLGEMLSAIGNWLPLYISGQVESWYSPRPGGERFSHTIFLAPGFACIHAGFPAGSERRATYRYDTDAKLPDCHARSYKALLSGCLPLVRIAPAADPELLLSLERRSRGIDLVLPTLSLATMPEALLKRMAERTGLERAARDALFREWESARLLFHENLIDGYVHEHFPLPPVPALRAGRVPVDSAAVRLSYRPPDFFARTGSCSRFRSCLFEHNPFSILALENRIGLHYIGNGTGASILFLTGGGTVEIGWIGTGNMGARMAERLARAGHRLYVYNRTKSKAQRVLDARDAELLDSPAEIGARCDLVFTSITNDAAMREVLFGETGLLKNARAGLTLVEMSTLSPAFSQELREALHSRGLLYLDAPVVGSMFMIEPGLLKILASGDDAAYQRALPYLNDIGRAVVPLGAGDQARCMKIAVNMMICSYLTIYGEVLLAGEGMGFGWEALNDLLEASGGASPMLSDKGTTHRERVWGSPAALTSTAMKDLGLALETASLIGFPLPLTAIVCQYDRYMHSSEKYAAYSTFGTIGVLEDWMGKGPGDYPPPGERKAELAGALQQALTGVTTLLAAEALRFCRETGIGDAAAKDCLGACHGASAYVKAICAGEAEKVSVAETRAALRTVLDAAKDAGLFVPILAAANEELTRAAASDADADLGALVC